MRNRIYRVFDRLPDKGITYRESLYDCENHEIHLWHVLPGEWIYPHTHPATDDIWYIIQGSGDYFVTADNNQFVSRGDLLLASPNDVHGLFNSGKEVMLVLSVLAPIPVEYNEAPGFVYPDD